MEVNAFSTQSLYFVEIKAAKKIIISSNCFSWHRILYAHDKDKYITVAYLREGGYGVYIPSNLSFFPIYNRYYDLYRDNLIEDIRQISSHSLFLTHIAGERVCNDNVCSINVCTYGLWYMLYTILVFDFTECRVRECPSTSIHLSDCLDI